MSSMSPARRGIALVAGSALAILFATAVAAGPSGARHADGTFIDATGSEIGSIHLVEDAQGHRPRQRQGRWDVGRAARDPHPCRRVVRRPDLRERRRTLQPASSASTAWRTRTGRTPATCRTSWSTPRATARLNAKTDRVTLSSGIATLLDGDGSAFIIHANPDDQVTDAGNGGSGPRIACGVIVAGEPRPGF